MLIFLIIIQIGWYTPDGGLHLVEPRSASNNNSSSSSSRPTFPFAATRRPSERRPTAPRVSPVVLQEEDRSTFARAITGISVPPGVEEPQEPVTRRAPTDSSDPPTSVSVSQSGTHLNHAWALIVLCCCCLGFIVAFVMLLYVSQKVCSDALPAASQSMGILLLVAVALLFASVLPWLFIPSPSVCVARHVLHPMLLVVCFAILLVKAMHLR